jgi:excisionase family DNA binding protein
MHPLDFSRPLPLLQTLYPGSFAVTAPEPETRPARLPGALLSTEEAADYLAISPVTLRRLCQRKAVTFVKPTPYEYRFLLRDLEEYVAARRNVRKSGVK